MSLLYAALVFGLVGQCLADISSEYNHFVALDPSQKIKFYWTVDQAEESISFAVEAVTTGWIGLGFSPSTGRMKGADIVIGWVKDGKPYLTDRHGEGYSLPPLDDSQDYKLISGTEKDGKTTMKFSRKFDTCDNQDYKFEEGTTRVIFAYHEEDPTSDTNMKKHSDKGSRSILLLNFVKTSKPNPSWKKLELLMRNMTIPKLHTSYMCRPFRLPDFGGKKHIVRFEPVVQPGNEGFVHHFVINECKGKFPDQLLNYTGNCIDYANMPAEILNCKRGDIIYGWGVGAGPFVYPEHVGYPVGMNDSGSVLIVEIHYDNPKNVEGRLDSSGVRLYYTSDLRAYDAGTLSVGLGVSSWMVIPPNQDHWITTGYCRKECTQKTLESSPLPEKGIKIISSFLHTHLAGRAIWTQHVRDGVQLPDIARDNNYDFNFQEIQVHAKEIHFRPGDEMIQQCKYNTKDRTKTTFGGLSTSEEMCINFITYYPRLRLLNSCSSSNRPAVYKFVEKHFPSYKAHSNRWYNPLVAAKPRWTDEMANDLRNFLDKENTISDCSDKANSTVKFAEHMDPKNLGNKVTFNKPYQPPPSACDVNSSSTALRVSIIHLSLISIWTIWALGAGVLSL
ncbi:DBH-like monooxygenase protein 1 isoform X2 [Actinia tenebrosa]|uniref:DBH-like monooxygenase protein 1 isoform X2 n=1 Tax=Actinia tenebrosa TaxID=6105 RepID=A0A6P8IVV7_ACTTE|nr:DBH-like monooxygenase protein 1 isoform X2 [Actinia tenebrosa]